MSSRAHLLHQEAANRLTDRTKERIMGALRAQQNRLTIAQNRRTLHAPVSGCCALSKHISAPKRAFVCT